MRAEEPGGPKCRDGSNEGKTVGGRSLQQRMYCSGVRQQLHLHGRILDFIFVFILLWISLIFGNAHSGFCSQRQEQKNVAADTSGDFPAGLSPSALLTGCS